MLHRDYGYPRPGRRVDGAKHRAVVALRDLWNFPDSYQVGVFEGAMETFGLRGDIRVRVHSLADVDLLITW